jgi:hypothetical protein
VAALGDLDGDGLIELAVGAETDNTGGVARGAVYVLSLSGMNTAPVFTSPAQVSVPENTTAVQTVTAIDAEAPPQTISYSIIGGPDQSRFAITSAGALSFNSPPNYEAPTDIGGDNVYVVIVQASDGSLSSLQAIVVTVTPVNDNSPVFTSPSAATVLEGTTSLMNITAIDADLPAQSVTLSLSGGADRAKFSLTNGQLAFIASPDFENPTDANGDNIYEVTVQADDGNGRTTLQTILVTVLPLPVDYGDAPDAAAGTGTGNYNSRAADSGSRHTIVPGLRIGANIDGDSGTLENGDANADDVNATLPDDEDGVSNPAADLALTIGAQPTVNVRVTNTTGTPATLYGWIDYNANGVFDNTTERASVAVPNGTNNAIVTLVFAAVPPGFHGETYARFRLSTDAAAANPTGAAGDGEVEDYRVTIIMPGSLTAESSKTHTIGKTDLNLPAGGFDTIGRAVANLGDVDGDGVTDLVVSGTKRNQGRNPGAVWVLFMNSAGTVRNSQQISSGVGGGPMLDIESNFGYSVGSLGDLDGDGVPDMAVGATLISGALRGEVHILFLKADGTVKRSTLIGNGTGGGPAFSGGDYFGHSLASLGDLDGDGVSDLAVGASRDNTGAYGSGAVYVLFMNTNGTVKAHQKIASGVGGGPILDPAGRFGTSLTSLGDIDGDGITDIAVGAIGDFSGPSSAGAVHIIRLNTNGTAKSSTKIGSGISGGPALVQGDRFGSALASLGDVDGDGVMDLAVGATGDDAGLDPNDPYSGNFGAVYMMLLNADGTVKRHEKIGNGVGGGPNLISRGSFGRAITSLGDLDGDGLTDLAVAGTLSLFFDGRVFILFLEPSNAPPFFTSPPTASIAENTTAVMTVMAGDPDQPPQTVTFSLTGGADQSKFSITNGGALTFGSPPNFDAPGDANGDNIYEVIVQASDGNGGTARQTIQVTVTPLNDHAPVFTSPEMMSVVENTTPVLTVSATDADLPPQAVTYSLVGGADQAKFNITGGGVLSFKSPPDFETPTDSNGDNIYIVIVQASDGSLTNLQAILVTVTNLSELPLTGDYNQSGTVDAADYVVWRNALGQAVVLPNDSTPGTVTQADYIEWRADFGRTLASGEPGAWSLELGAGSMEPGAGSVTLSGVEAAGPHPLDSSRPLPEGEVAERLVHRPTRRGALVPDSSRDDALVAWLASRAVDLKHRMSGDEFADIPNEIDFDEHVETSINELDLAFAAV